MVGIYYSRRRLAMPAGGCPQCRECLLAGNKVKKTAHICGIPIFPLRSEYTMFCWNCGFVSRLHSGRNFYYPGRRHPGSWLTYGHWGKGRSGEYDRRQQNTYHFYPRHPWRLRFRRW